MPGKLVNFELPAVDAGRATAFWFAFLQSDDSETA